MEQKSSIDYDQLTQETLHILFLPPTLRLRDRREVDSGYMADFLLYVCPDPKLRFTILYWCGPYALDILEMRYVPVQIGVFT